MITVHSAQITGLAAQIIPVEVDVSPGLHVFSIVGLADKEVQESRERVGAAIRNINARSPQKQSGKVIVSLAPADIKKEGPHFDLPIAVGYLLASRQAVFSPEKKIFLGELGLQGVLRPVQGVLPIALAAKAAGFSELYVPKGNGAEAALVDGILAYEFDTIESLLDHLEGRAVRSPMPRTDFHGVPHESTVDFSDIRGQDHAKRALEIAAGGSHNVLLWGPPGSGKTMLAKAFPSILPPLSFDEALEVTNIHSIAGFLKKDGSLIATRPIRAPHHTASTAAIVGGGTHPMPGEITLAHRGVLFLDEFPEFQRAVIEGLREPLEEKSITVTRAREKVTFPAHAILVAAMNPCPCGNRHHPKKECTCRETDIHKYHKKISGPIMDRIDLFAEVPFQEFEKIHASGADAGLHASSEDIRARVIRAREVQRLRLAPRGMLTNADMGSREIKLHCTVPPEAEHILKKAVSAYALSTRSYYRILKVARTIADLADTPSIATRHVLEALQYRHATEV